MSGGIENPWADPDHPTPAPDPPDCPRCQALMAEIVLLREQLEDERLEHIEELERLAE